MSAALTGRAAALSGQERGRKSNVRLSGGESVSRISPLICLCGMRPLRAAALPVISRAKPHRAFHSPYYLSPKPHRDFRIPSYFSRNTERVLHLCKSSHAGFANVSSAFENRALFPLIEKGIPTHFKKPSRVLGCSHRT